VHAPARFEVDLVFEREKVCHALISFEDDASAMSAASAVGPAAGHKFFFPEAQAPVSAIARFDINFHSVNKFFFHGHSQSSSNKKSTLRGLFIQNYREPILYWHYMHKLLISFRIKLDLSRCLGKERVVKTHAHIGPRIELGAPLPQNDVAGLDHASSRYLYPEPFGIAVPAVSGAAYAFFMSK
jgi:hypothetical protein